MINWNDLKNFDLNDVDLTKLDFSRFDVRNIELPNVEMPSMEMPNVELPSFELPNVELPSIEMPVDRIAGFAHDTAYAGVGAVVITVQKADERRRELTDQVSTQVRKLVDSVG